MLKEYLVTCTYGVPGIAYERKIIYRLHDLGAVDAVCQALDSLETETRETNFSALKITCEKIVEVATGREMGQREALRVA